MNEISIDIGSNKETQSYHTKILWAPKPFTAHNPQQPHLMWDSNNNNNDLNNNHLPPSIMRLHVITIKEQNRRCERVDRSPVFGQQTEQTSLSRCDFHYWNPTLLHQNSNKFVGFFELCSLNFSYVRLKTCAFRSPNFSSKTHLKNPLSLLPLNPYL